MQEEGSAVACCEMVMDKERTDNKNYKFLLMLPSSPTQYFSLPLLINQEAIHIETGAVI
jgi:hypothetical protein